MLLKNIEFVHLSNIKESFDADTSAPLMPTFSRFDSKFKGFQLASTQQSEKAFAEQKKDNINTTSSDVSHMGDDSQPGSSAKKEILENGNCNGPSVPTLSAEELAHR